MVSAGTDTQPDPGSWDRPLVFPPIGPVCPYCAPARTADGRKIDTWNFLVPGKNGPKIVETITIHIMDRDGLAFEARSPRLPDKVVRDTDIERLRTTVETALNKVMPDLMPIKWENWLEVRVTGANTKSSARDEKEGLVDFGGVLKIEVIRLQRGIDPETGEAVTISRNQCIMPFSKAREYGKPDSDLEAIKTIADYVRTPWAHRDSDSHVSRAYIPETPENVAKLEELLERMATLRSRVADMLSQEQIVRALDPVKALPILPLAPSAPPGRTR